MANQYNPSIPLEFQPLIDTLVYQALKGGSNVSQLDLLAFQEWLEGDGYEWFLSGWEDELVAINLNELARSTFSDTALEDYFDVNDTIEIPEFLRPDYARDRIDYEFEFCGDKYISKIHPLPVSDSAGKTAFLGYTAHFRGQLGVEIFYHGTFKTDQDFFVHLSLQKFVFPGESEGISDSALLELWQK